jgi:signal transduction histidine kinase
VVDNGRLTPEPSKTGHGLLGMKERTALYGGSFEAGLQPGGGFAVHATLRLDEQQNADKRPDN